jgi:hypothetical protein
MFEGAIAWEAWKLSKGSARHQGVLGMYTVFMEARALYEFIHSHKLPLRFPDEARADDFASPPWQAKKSAVYSHYMDNKKPANKRMFHLVYRRSKTTGPAGELNEQVLNVTKDLLYLSQEFVTNINDDDLRALGEKALQDATNEAQKAADHYGITNPLV